MLQLAMLDPATRKAVFVESHPAERLTFHTDGSITIRHNARTTEYVPRFLVLTVKAVN